MTISSTVRIAGPFTGNGVTTTFPFTYKVFSTADVQVIRLTISTGLETTLTIVTDYTITLNGDQDSNPGGNIVLVTPLLALYTLTATSDIANLQPTDLTNQGGFFPEVITDALDRATIQIQQLADQTDRAIKIPISDGVLDMTTPVVLDRQGKYLAFDSLGLPIASAGTGNDTALRTDLANDTAASAGSRLSGFRQTGTGATARTVDDKLKDTVSVKDFGSNLGVALTALGATETTLIIDDDVTVSVNTTIPVTLAIEVKNGSVITINNTIVLTINGSFSAGMNKVFDGAGATNTVFAAVGDIFARWFGAKGDDSTDDSTSIQKAINVAQQSDNANVVFGSGIFRIGTTLSITNANKGISIIGTRDSALQQGSTNSNCVIKWVGGAGHCFTSTVTFCNFYSMTFLNAAGYNALSAINLTPNAFGHSVIEDVTVTFITAGQQFATACFILEGASYSKINRCYLNGSTTGILFTGTTSTTTNILNCEFDYPATALETCYSIKLNSNIEILTCEQCTFNLYHNTQAFNTAASVGFDSAHFFDCEFDSNSGSIYTKVAYINDFRFVRFDGCAISQLGSTTGGIIQALSSAGNPYAQSVISINNCHGASLNSPLVQTDGNAKIVVNCGLNSFNAGSTGLVIGTSAKSALLFDIDTAAVTYLPLLGQKFPANLDGVYQIETTTNLNRQIVVGNPTDSAPLTGSMEKGQKFLVKIKNTSGGALTVLTFGSQFKMPALVLPATGFSRSYYFVYDGTNAIELTRSAADIPN